MFRIRRIYDDVLEVNRSAIEQAREILVARPPRQRSLRHITAVHDPRLVSYLRRACREVGDGKASTPTSSRFATSRGWRSAAVNASGTTSSDEHESALQKR